MDTLRRKLVTPAHTTSYLEAGPDDGPSSPPGTGCSWRQRPR